MGSGSHFASLSQDWSVGTLFERKLVKSVSCSHVGSNKYAQKQYLAGELEIHFTPQGTLAERMRAGGAGIPAFFTPTGYGTKMQEGGFPIKFNADGTPAILSSPKEAREFNGRWCVMEQAIRGDVALIKAWKSDKYVRE